MILALINNKGGVGKTTTAVNLASGLVGKKRRILLVDLDSQGSASLSLGIARSDLTPSSANVLLDRMPIRKAIRNTAIKGLDILPGSMELANADLVLADASGREKRLKAALELIRDDYDFIILDCPPSLALLPITALVSSDAYIVPVTPQYLALEGLVNLMEAIERARDGIGIQTSLLGLLLTMVDYRMRVTSEIVDIIRNHHKSQVFETEIRVNVRLGEAPSFGKTIFEYDDSSTGADAYRRLTKEVLRRCRKGRKS
jgi:chromosome partitioning protein